MPPKSKSSVRTPKRENDRDLKLLPAFSRCCLEGQWTACPPKLNEQFTIFFQDEFKTKFFLQPYIDSFIDMDNKIARKLTSLGRDVNKENIFGYLLAPVLPMITEFTTEQLVKSTDDNHSAITVEELWKFINVKNFCNSIKL